MIKIKLSDCGPPLKVNHSLNFNLVGLNLRSKLKASHTHGVTAYDSTSHREIIGILAAAISSTRKQQCRFFTQCGTSAFALKCLLPLSLRDTTCEYTRPNKALEIRSYGTSGVLTKCSSITTPHTRVFCECLQA